MLLSKTVAIGHEGDIHVLISSDVYGHRGATSGNRYSLFPFRGEGAAG
jgi:hypothetical protein